MTNSGMPSIAVTDLPDDATLLDVREDDEWTAGHAPGAVHVPLNELGGRMDEIPQTQPVYVICRSGGRSARAAQFLAAHDVDVVNVDGGTQAWAQAGKPLVSENGDEPTVA